MGINEERLKEIIGAGKLWCGDPDLYELLGIVTNFRKGLEAIGE